MSRTKPAAGRIVVQKFGGSSLAGPELRALAVDRVRAEVAAGATPVVVVSAIGRAPSPYATDTLLDLLPGRAGGPNVDLLLSAGETISAALFAELLNAADIAARALTGGQAGIVTDQTHGEAKIVGVDPAPLRALIAEGIVPVVAGFQGVARDGRITTLGRGGSDLTAVAIAHALGGAPLDIYTDVDGVLTADPRRVPQAHAIEALDFEELSELASQGAKVMHDRAAELARLTDTNFSIKGLRSGNGTEVGSGVKVADSSKPVTGVATMLGYAFVHVVPEAAAMAGGWEEHAFRMMAENSINLDCINVNGAGVFFIVRDSALERARDLLDELPVAVRTRRDCAKISIVGAGMRGTPGVMHRVVQALVGSGIPIIHSTDSNITISVLVPGSLAGAAEQALHTNFELDKGGPS